MTGNLSLEARLAQLDEITRLQVLSEVFEVVDPGELLYNWEYQGRPSQLEATNSDAHKTLVLAGRGFGKTRTGSEWVRKKTTGHRPTRGFLAARTASDVRDTLIQGESGLLNIFPPSEMPRWVASQRTVYFANGSTALCLSAQEPDQARGPQAEWSLCDEWATWRFSSVEGELDLWDNIQIATRLGSDPQIMITTTPKRIAQVRELVAAAKAGDQGVRIVTGSTFENVALSGAYLDTMTKLYGGSRLEMQELFAVVLDEIEGALWSEAHFTNILHDPGEKLPLRVVGVDPSVADEPRDECGIVIVGATNESRPMDRRGWVLDDRSGIMAPSKWAKVVVDSANEYKATVVAEANQGGAMVREMIHNLDPTVRVKLVHAKQSKKLRAEPVAAVYDQGRIRHKDRFAELQEQMTSWVPGETKDSPDRVDAMVHAFTGLLLPSSRGVASGQTKLTNPAKTGLVIPTRSRHLARRPSTLRR